MTAGGLWARVVRADCSGVTEAQAKLWLHEYANVVHIACHKAKNGLAQVVGIDMDDLRTVGQMAVLEACVTYSPTNAGGATLRTWVGTVVRWRVGDLLQRATRPPGEVVGHDYAVTLAEALEVDDFEERMDTAEQLHVIAEQFTALPHRTKIILLQRLHGATSRETAQSLGISTNREMQLVERSRALFRAVLAKNEGVVTGPGAPDGTSSV